MPSMTKNYPEQNFGSAEVEPWPKTFQFNLRVMNDGFPFLSPFGIQTVMPMWGTSVLNAWELIWYHFSVLVTFMNVSLAIYFARLGRNTSNK